ncbi:bifunctional diaminohydroxyphosphoribosylaminopyrimidine deaminase/5-amino-6-(5-phosphoribosylamino)uracil reductase RibD [Candidatus Poriferisodalis sp.]|uniref:bifunctional diaminohydroxyphosphoribosylaminopyrimidine deaminase/5-amino-6-(5-phosphoribosylamino)uracil reductase RibD n=1 Tax=Candidatus Poriferisodalis sp. TaxID=3101277 RepID=UPI003B01038C
MSADADRALMRRAVELGELVRGTTAPNPWVGAVLSIRDGAAFDGATQPPPGRHAEIVALEAARARGADPAGATLFTTLEPCSHTGRTPPCVETIIAAGVERVVIGTADPDPNVSGTGIEALRAAGIEVVAGVGASEVEASLRPYLHQRRAGRPWVVLKLASTLDGRTGAPDGSSQWITATAARADAHGLRARCDAVLVGARTVRADNPRLTVRDLPLDDPRRPLVALRDGQQPTCRLPITPSAAARLDPRRYVLGTAPARAEIRPCVELGGPLPEVLCRLAADGVVELLVEGGARVAGDLHRAGLVDEYVVYVAPALMGGDDGRPLMAGAGAGTMDALWRGQIADVRRVGPDVRLVVHRLAAQPAQHSGGACPATVGADPLAASAS